MYFLSLLEVEPPTRMSIDLSETEKAATIMFDVVEGAKSNRLAYDGAIVRITYPNNLIDNVSLAYPFDDQTIEVDLISAQIGVHVFELSLSSFQLRSNFFMTNKTRGMLFNI